MTISRHAKAKLKDRPIPIRHIKPGTRAFDRSIVRPNGSLPRSVGFSLGTMIALYPKSQRQVRSFRFRGS